MHIVFSTFKENLLCFNQASTLSMSVVICLAKSSVLKYEVWCVISIHNTFKSIADGRKVINIYTKY